MNLIARPGGGWLADKFGRKRVLLILMACMSVGYTFLGLASTLPLAIIAVLFASAFVQATEGAVFATVPLVSPRDTGRVAGIVGAAGNVGGVLFPLAFGYGLQWSGGSYFPGFFIVAIASVVGLIVVSTVKLPEGEEESVQAGFSLGIDSPERVRLRGKSGGLRRK
jgi:NNP family nitrate/nitrite transporter-like MFS transporter